MFYDSTPPSCFQSRSDLFQQIYTFSEPFLTQYLNLAGMNFCYLIISDTHAKYTPRIFRFLSKFSFKFQSIFFIFDLLKCFLRRMILLPDKQDSLLLSGLFHKHILEAVHQFFVGYTDMTVFITQKAVNDHCRKNLIFGS